MFLSIISLVNIPASTNDLPIVSIPLLNSFAFFNMSAFLSPDSTPSLVKKFLTYKKPIFYDAFIELSLKYTYIYIFLHKIA